MTHPMYSFGDAVAPYRSYGGSMRLVVGAGSVQMPLAYKAVPAGQTPNKTSRLIQVHEPTAIVVVEWAGIRVGLKPEPPKIISLGTFLLARAGGQCSGPLKTSMGQDILEASGYLVLYTADRPEAIELPAFWFPWDGRYGTSTTEVPQYLYTPEELGFKVYLPGQSSGASPTNSRVPNNPPAVSPAVTGSGNKLFI